MRLKKKKLGITQPLDKEKIYGKENSSYRTEKGQQSFKGV